MNPSDLTPRQGKVLRYIVSADRPIGPEECVVTIEWSDLPHTIMQAIGVISKLSRLGLVESSGDGHVATEAGKKLILRANYKKRWQKAPPPEKTNKPTRRQK
jgi:hypothetical protein